MMPLCMAMQVIHGTTPERASSTSITNGMNGSLRDCSVPHLHNPKQQVLNIYLTFLIISDFQAQVSVTKNRISDVGLETSSGTLFLVVKTIDNKKFDAPRIIVPEDIK